MGVTCNMSLGSDAIQDISPRVVAKAPETWHQEQFCSVIRLISGTFCSLPKIAAN